MSISTEYLNKVKEKYNLANNNQLANFLNQFLDTSPQGINNYYKRGSEFNMEMTFLIADLLDISTEEIIAKISREKAKSGKNREFWEKKLKGIITIFIINLVVFMPDFVYAISDIYYVK